MIALRLPVEQQPSRLVVAERRLCVVELNPELDSNMKQEFREVRVGLLRLSLRRYAVGEHLPIASPFPLTVWLTPHPSQAIRRAKASAHDGCGVSLSGRPSFSGINSGKPAPPSIALF